MGGGRGEQGSGGKECRKTLNLYQVPGFKTRPGPGCSTPGPPPPAPRRASGERGSGKEGRRARAPEGGEGSEGGCARGARGPAAPPPPRGPRSRSGADVTAGRRGGPCRGDWRAGCSGLAGAGAPSPPGRRSAAATGFSPRELSAAILNLAEGGRYL